MLQRMFLLSKMIQNVCLRFVSGWYAKVLSCSHFYCIHAALSLMHTDICAVNLSGVSIQVGCSLTD